MSKAKKKTEEGSINLVDLFFYLLSYWYWFVLGVILCAGYAAYQYSKASFIYKSDATVVIKDPANSTATARLDAYSSLVNRTNVSNEILQFKSKDLMREVVRRIDADINYKTKVKLRMVELYKNSPVQIIIADSVKNASFALSIIPKDDKSINVSFGSAEKLVALNDSVATPFGKMVFIPTATYDKQWYGKEIKIKKVGPTAAANGFRSRMSIRQASDDASILNFSIQDYNRERAVDILNTLFQVYNENAIADKNQVAVNTAKFINELIRIIGGELGDVEASLRNYKTSHVLMDANQSANMYLNESRASNAVVADLDTKLSLAGYIKDYLTDPTKSNEMIPSNTGLDDLRIEGMISQYNTTKMNRDRYLEDSSEDNPVIQGLDASLESMKTSIVRSIDNLEVSLGVQRGDAQKQERTARANFSRMPSAAHDMLTIERQQKIKENLYMFLLNKREENALSQAMVDNNARIIDEAEASWAPIAPVRNKMLMLGILLGLMIPAVILFARLFLDTRVRTRKEIEESVDVPFVGEIPLSKRSRKEQKEDPDNILFYNHDDSKKSLLTEAFRNLVINMEFMGDGDKKSQVITVSSFSASSGKSFVTINLAACLADNKKKVVIIDLDLRKRTLSRRYEIAHRTTGASHYLYDSSVTLADVLHKDVIPGVDVVPAGMVPPNPVELLKRSRLDQLIDEQLVETPNAFLLDNDYEKIKDSQEVHIIGHITEKGMPAVMVTPQNTTIELKAQGWQSND